MNNQNKLCWNCPNRMVQLDFFGYDAIVGCKELTKSKWEEGNYVEGGEVRQHNCPLDKPLNND